jgi:hypothetical protein
MNAGMPGGTRRSGEPHWNDDSNLCQRIERHAEIVDVHPVRAWANRLNIVRRHFLAAQCLPQNDGLRLAAICLLAGARNDEAGE